MNILSIDIGSYSVKFLEFRADGRHLTLDHCQEVVLKDVAQDFDEEHDISELQHEIVKAYLGELQFSGKVVQQIPRDSITHRFIELPVNNRKKAELMVPHQLDDNLPYSISKAHYSCDLMKEGNHFHALVAITQLDSFEHYFSTLSRDKILPTHMISELGIMNSYAAEYGEQHPICILDIGHATTKAYFIINGRVVAAHSSYLAGKNITEMIAETYQISEEQAVEYKHHKSFFLTEGQYSQVTDAQKEFAEIMRQTISPLVSDFKRWELGFKVKHAISLEKVLLTGGSSNIENIEHFLTEVLGITVEKLTNLPTYRNKIELSDKEQAIFANGRLMAATQIAKRPPVNFLRGNFASGFSDTISLHSTFFIMARTLIVMLILCVGLIVDMYIQSNREEQLDRQINKEIKNPAFELSAKELRKVKTDPRPVLNKIQKMERSMQQSIKTFENASEQGAVDSLVSLSQVVGANNKISMTSFNYESGLALATFVAEDSRELEDLDRRLKKSTLTSLRVNFTPGQNELTAEFRE